MIDWRDLYQLRDWIAIENWWRNTDETAQAKELLEWLQRDVPRVTRQNGFEEKLDSKRPDEAPEEWKGAAKILYMGELEALVEGEPERASEEWQRERDKVVGQLEKFTALEEVTDGDPELSRRSHADKALDFLKQIELGFEWMSHEVDPDEREWLLEVIAHTAHNAFSAGVHAFAAAGKEIEVHALRGQKIARSASAGGKSKNREGKLEREKLLAYMQASIEKDHSVSAAAEHAYNAGLGPSPSANRKRWYRNRKLNPVQST